MWERFNAPIAAIPSSHSVPIMTNPNTLNVHRHTASPGFWCYISSHLHGTAGPSSTTAKTPASSSTGSATSSTGLNGPAFRTPISTAPTTAAATVPTTNSRATNRTAAQSYVPGHLTEVPRVSGSGPGAPTKTLNRFLRGKSIRGPPQNIVGVPGAAADSCLV